MAITLRYFSEFGRPALQKRSVAEFMQESIVFLLRVQCRRKESSRSLSHLLMSFLFCQSLPVSHLIDERQLIFFNKLQHTDNPILRTLSHWPTVKYEILWLAAKYGLNVVQGSLSAMKDCVWTCFVQKVRFQVLPLFFIICVFLACSLLVYECIVYVVCGCIRCVINLINRQKRRHGHSHSHISTPWPKSWKRPSVAPYCRFYVDLDVILTRNIACVALTWGVVGSLVIVLLHGFLLILTVK